MKYESDLKHQLYRPEALKNDTRAGSLTADESNELLGSIDFEDTGNITVSENLIDQVIGRGQHLLEQPFVGQLQG